jgi:hypothetical protein
MKIFNKRILILLNNVLINFNQMKLLLKMKDGNAKIVTKSDKP